MILARSTNRYGAVRERTKVWRTLCSSAVSSRNCSGCLISASFLILSLFAPFYFTMDLVIAPLSGAFGKCVDENQGRSIGCVHDQSAPTGFPGFSECTTK